MATSSTQYLRVKPDENTDTSILLNCKKVKETGDLIVENCIFNQLVLGIYKFPFEQLTQELWFPENLKPYQIEDVQKMVACREVLNFNRMGYGKTVEAIKAMRELQIDTALIIAPKSVLAQWVAQIKKWYPEMRDKVGIYSEKWVPKQGRIVVTNYEKLIKDTNLQRFKSWQWPVLIADEAHRIKNRNSKRTKAIKEIPAQRKWALTGTPITRLADDLWSILNFLGPFYSGRSYWNFVYFFCDVKDGFFGLEIKGLTKDERRLDILHQALDAIGITHPDLQLTPGKQVENVQIAMDASQKKLYKNTKNLVLDELPEGMTIANGAVLVTRLMQVTSNPSQFIKDCWGAKFDYIGDFLEDEPGKVVIFSKFATTCKSLHRYLEHRGFKTNLYIGEMDAVDRYESKQGFVTEEEVVAIIGTIGAMGEGVDGLQDVCHNVIFIDRDFSPEINKQAEDRLNRIGQRHHVFIQYLECEKTYDKHVTTTNLRRADDIRRALSD